MQPSVSDKAHIHIVATGGTIAGRAQLKTQTTGYQAAVLGIDELLKDVPLLESAAYVTGEQFSQIASENMSCDIWLRLSKRVNELLADDGIDGIVITHGTDTLEETAYFLNLTVKSPKPVVLAGAMRPHTAISADGPLNIYNAVLCASDKQSIGKGVLVSMDDSILCARDVIKSSTYKTSTFEGGEYGCIGNVQNGVVRYYYMSTKRHTFASEFDVFSIQSLPPVEILYEYAGSGETLLQVAARHNKGIVIACMGNGSLNDTLLNAIAQLPCPPVIVRSSRIQSGPVSKDRRYDLTHHTLSADNLSPQKARILLQLALTKTRDLQTIQQYFETY